MHTRLLTGLVVLGIVVAGGCKRSPISKDAEAKPDPTLEAIAEARAEEAEDFEGLRSEIVAWRNTTAAQRAEPDFKQDLAVAKRLASQLSREASKQQDAEAGRTVARLIRCLASLVASAPANRIGQHLERAELALQAGDIEAASGEVLSAAGVAYNPSAPALVPAVLEELEKALEALKAGDAAKATEIIGEVMREAEGDNTSGDLGAAHQTALEARPCVQRKSWPIVIAQMTEVSTTLKRVEQRATPQATPEEAAKPTASAEEEDEAEPKPAPEAAKPETGEGASGADAKAEEGGAKADEEEPEADTTTT